MFKIPSIGYKWQIFNANQYRISILKSNLIHVRLFEKMSEDYNQKMVNLVPRLTIFNTYR